MVFDDSKFLYESDLLKVKQRYCGDSFDKNIKIARYMEFKKFKDMLEMKSIYFSNIEKFDDNKERTIPKGFFRNHSIDQIKSRNMLEQIKDDKYKSYVSCWTEYGGENYSFWRIYTPQHDGVCIICDFKKLYEQFNNNYIIPYKVEYVDFNDNEFKIDLPWLYVKDDNFQQNYVLRIKEKYKIYPYKDEREIRFLAFYEKRSNIVPDGCLVKVKNFDWIEDIMISPFAKEETEDKIISLALQHGIQKSKIKYSVIDESAKAEEK